MEFIEDPNLLDVLRIMETDHEILSVTEKEVKVKVLNSIVTVPIKLWTDAIMTQVL